MPIFLQGQELPLNVTFRGDRLKMVYRIIH